MKNYPVTISLIGLTFILLVGCNATKTTDMKIEQSLPEDRIKNACVLTPEEAYLSSTGKFEKYQSASETGVNYRLFRAQTFREMGFIWALTAYWDVNDRFPSGDDPADIISTLESDNLLPFWPVNPETGEPVKIVSSEDDVIDWSDLFITLADNGSFDFTTVFRSGIDPYSPYIETRTTSILHDNMNHAESVNHGNTLFDIEYPGTPEEAFSHMVKNWFLVLVKEAFLVNGGQVPGNLVELLAGRVVINPAGWGHPAGPLDPDQPGNFEFGVDPVVNGYYFDFTSTQNGRMRDYYMFVKKEYEGKEFYDLSTSVSCIHEANRSEIRQFTKKIPLLTDELFSGPPPEL